MSSRPEPPDLEGFIEDSFFFDRMAPGSRERLIAFYEPHRAQIEYAMTEDYDPEIMSWRDWRNDYWNYILPKHPKELTMSDEEVRALERAAPDDPDAKLMLTTARIRRRSGVVWVWIELPGQFRAPLVINGPPVPAPVPNPPSGAIETTIFGYISGGEAAFEGEQSATPKRAWVIACMNVEDGVFGRESLPESNLSGPHLLDLGSLKLVLFGATEGISVEPSLAREP